MTTFLGMAAAGFVGSIAISLAEDNYDEVLPRLMVVAAVMLAYAVGHFG